MTTRSALSAAPPLALIVLLAAASGGCCTRKGSTGSPSYAASVLGRQPREGAAAIADAVSAAPCALARSASRFPDRARTTLHLLCGD